MRGFVWDIEVAKMKFEHMGYDRKFYSEYLPSDAIKRPRWLPCASWKQIGKPHVHSVCVLDDPERFKKDYSDDYVVVKALSDLMNEADYIVAHNGDNFDWKILTARLLFHGLPPIPRIQSIDTLKIARSQFRLEANDLRYLARYLKLPIQKDEAPDWDLVSIGDVAEIKKCAKYNKKDTLVLEPIYERLLPFSKAKLYYGDEKCPVCGSEKYQSKGGYRCSKGKWNYQCSVKSCSHRWRGKPPKSRKVKERV